MVSLKQIEFVVEKCLTHARIKEKLSALSRNEKIQLLTAQNKMTRAEFEDYDRLITPYNRKAGDIEDEMEEAIEKYREDYYDDYDEYPTKIPKSVTKEYEKLLEDNWKEADEELFFYEQRIFQNYEISKGDNPIPKFSWDDYVYDKNGKESFPEEYANDSYSMKLRASRESIGDIENTQLDNQSNINYTDKELSWLKQYFTDGRLSSFLTYTINGREPKQYNDMKFIQHDGNYEEFDTVEYNLTDEWKSNFRNIKYHLDNAIDKSNGLDKPTILYHAGRIDPSLLPGDKGVWKGYKSMSFQEQSMVKHSNINDDYWNIIVLAPTGTKGVCANDERFIGYSYVDEHEYLTGRNTEYTVVNMDFDTHTEIVILD